MYATWDYITPKVMLMEFLLFTPFVFAILMYCTAPKSPNFNHGYKKNIIDYIMAIGLGGSWIVLGKFW